MDLWVLHDGKTTRCWVRRKKSLMLFEACRPPTKDTAPKDRQVSLATDGGLIGLYVSLKAAQEACRDFVMGVTPNGT